MIDEEVKDFLVKNFGEYFKSTKEKLYSKLCEEQNIRKFAELIYIFLATPDNAEKYVEIMQSNSSYNWVYHCNTEILSLSDLDLQLINTKSMIKNKLKELLSELKKFKVQTILVLEYKEMIVKSSIQVPN